MESMYNKNDLTHRHLNDICAVCGARRGLHNHMNQRCPLKGSEETSADHTEYRDTVFAAIKQPQLSFTREQVIDLLAKYGDHYATGMAQDKWTDPDFKEGIVIATEFLDSTKI